MGLATYQEKRDFERTPEPAGSEAEGQGPLRFVVQKHRATQLHHDFRLEFGGALKSWAIPKGPSLDPDDKRLAVMVEDHPLDYLLFEGSIPKGNYGAGTVMVWDEGTYEPRQPGSDRAENERIMQQGLDKGHMTFILHGHKLRGEFALVKLQRGEPNAWLLLKKRDEFAGGDIPEVNRSALSGRTMDEIAQQATAAGDIWPSQKAPPLELSDFPEAEMPREVAPMLAKVVAEPFDRAGWLFEIKWDGYRALAEVDGENVRLYSRTRQSFNGRYKAIVDSLQRLKHRVVLDGEIVVVDDAGKPSFQLLQQLGTDPRGTLIYSVFDLLYLDGHDLRHAPLVRRKELLRQILPALPQVRYSDHIPESGRAFFQVSAAQGLEGVIAKNGQSPYLSGRRSDHWLKIKTELRQDAVIGGFTSPRGTRQDLGALVLGVYEGEDFVYIGHAGTGMDEQMLARLRAVLEPLARETSPFKTKPVTNAPVRWVEPCLVCTVSFKEWTHEGSMRQPVFLGLREDMPARSVHREVPGATPPPPPPTPNAEAPPEPKPSNGSPRRTFSLYKKQEQSVEIGGRRLKLTNLDKIYWPDERYKKRDLVDYYRAVASFILPYLKDRPESLNRHPDGIAGENFFQKDVASQPPDWVEAIEIQSESHGDSIRYLICQDEATLVYMANLGCIELNPWSSRTQSLDRPDYLVIDLDPESIPFERVVQTACAVREVLQMGGIDGVCKTSGSRGLHIYVPLGAHCTYEQTRQLGELIARLVHARIPEWTSLERSPSRRQGKVYLDYLQNRRGQTLAAPYSVRPRPGATVSTPLRWDEVTPELNPADFTIRTILQRLETVGDLWKPVLGPGIDVDRFLQALAGEGSKL